MGWDFKDRATAERLLKLANEYDLEKRGVHGRKYARAKTNQAILVKTPSSGIGGRTKIGDTETGRDEYQLGYAECVLLSTYDNGSTPNARDQTNIRSVRKPGLYSTSVGYGATEEEKDAWKNDITDVIVVNPFDKAIPGDKIITAVNIDGTYVATTTPAAKRIEFVLKTSLISGEATAYVLDPPPDTPGNYEEVTVKDPKKLFYGAIGAEEPTRNDLSACSADLTYYAEEPGAIGWATQSADTGDWIIKQCTLPVQRFSAEVPGGITAPSDRFSGQLNEVAKSVYFNPEDSLSPYPHVDMPPEVMCNPGDENMDKELMVQALNPHRFTIIPGSTVTIERRIKEVPVSEYTGENVNPHENPEPSAGVIRNYEWVIVDAEKTIARWARCKIKAGSATCEWEYDDADQYKEGFDPRAFFGSDVQQAPKDDVPVIPAPGLGGCECGVSIATIPAPETVGWAFFDNNSTQYVVVTTKSAMLGKPTGTDYIQDFDINGSSGCSISSSKTSGMLGWACNAAAETSSVSLPTREIEYIANIEGGCNVICPRFESATVLDCGSNTAARLSCMNIYADPCEPCSGNCNWIFDSSTNQWIEDDITHDCTPEDGDCGCEGSKPEVTGTETNGDTTQTPCAVWNDPPEPAPCEKCDECPNQDLTIDTLDYSANNFGVGSIYNMVEGSVNWVGNCTWEVDVIWQETDPARPGGTPAPLQVTATITLSGGVWSCSVPPSQSGVAGDWSYTDPADPCQTSIFQKLDDGTTLITSQSGQATVTFSVSGPACP